jgi:succinate dehydrogenase/fumarate reductase-like Fe-S protein
VGGYGEGRDMSAPETARLRIRRGKAGEDPRYDEVEVPFEPGQSLLDGLRWVRGHRDASLAIRYSCINANACKECVVKLDGKVVYACTARLQPQAMTVEPLSNKPLIRDLVTDIVPPGERL